MKRPGTRPLHNVVTEQDIANLYVEHAAAAVRLVRRICGELHGDALYLLERRGVPRAAPGEAYFLRAVVDVKSNETVGFGNL